jgi:uncharacterized Zn finger protein
MTYLLFAWAPSGYELREQEGDPPKVGDSIEVDGRRVWITKLGVSPLPSDQRPCVYSMG